MAINISNILTQLNTKMTTDSSASTTELLRRVKAYNDLNNAGRVFEYQSYGDLPTVDSSNIGQLAYVRSSLDDSFGTFFFSKALANDSGYLSAIDSTNSGWQKIVLNANDSDNFADIVAAIAPYSFQGSTSGYTSGGAGAGNIIQKFSFTADGNATDVGDLTDANVVYPVGNSSSSSGYRSGGKNPLVNAGFNTIDKFPFATDANATDVGDLLTQKHKGSSASNEFYGYDVGSASLPASPFPTVGNVIEKFSFSTDENSTDVGNLLSGNYAGAGQSSADNGYSAGGFPARNVIEKFPFATDANTTDVGDLTQTAFNTSGQSSVDNGYRSGGQTPTVINSIDKHPFATDANATDVGDLTGNRYQLSGQSSTTNGYTAGGNIPPNTNIIDKFPFSSDASATDVGDLTLGRQQCSGSQY